MAVNVSELVESPTKDQMRRLVDTASETHYWYHDTVERASIMSMFYKGMEVTESDISQLKKILPQSVSESDSDYNHRIERTPVIPFEKKFVRAKERIFQGHGVSRDFPEQEAEKFWKDKFKHYDDSGESVDKFFRKKVFYYKEVLGFGGVVVDLLTKQTTDPDTGQIEYTTFTDEDGEPVPYTYLVRPNEIYNFGFYQGYLQYVIIRQNVAHRPNEFDYRYTALTPTHVYVWNQDLGDEKHKEAKDRNPDNIETQLIIDEEHPFEEVPFTFIKGDEDIDSAYKIGRPERYSLVPMYRTALEIYYDLQEVSLLYGHPVPVMGENTVKELVGAVDDDGKYNPEHISAELGAVVQIPDNEEFPNQLFYQPETQGLQHLKDYLFELIEKVHQFASIRDKTQIVANTSGVSKALDTVEERGVLADSSRDMEEIERNTNRLMAKSRSDVDFEDDYVVYQKEFDLSTATEHFETLIEGMSNDALTFEMYKYHAVEGLRKSGAPKEAINTIKDNLDEFGKPLEFAVSDLLELLKNAEPEFKEQLVKDLGKEIKILENFSGSFEEQEAPPVGAQEDFDESSEDDEDNESSDDDEQNSNNN